MVYLLLGVLAAVAIIGTAVLAPRVQLSAPVVLVLLGFGISLLPFIPTINVPPELILAGVLPPLLYSTSVSMPAMDFRRDFTTIAGLSVVLVVITAVALGFLFAWVVPGVNLPIGIALGAIISPTDAVATSIVRKLGVSSRVVTMLEGESLLNDASALVLLRSAIAVTGVSMSVWGVVSDFIFSVAVAAAIGFLVGWVGLWVRHKVTDAGTNTAISFVVPFIAFIPAELAGASGLVAAVTTGLVTSVGAPRFLRPQDRISDEANWRTAELLLEGAIFLVMGLQLRNLVMQHAESGGALWLPIALAIVAVIVVLVVRAGYLAPLLWGLNRRSRRAAEVRGHLVNMQKHLDGSRSVVSNQLSTPDDDGANQRGSTAKRRRRRAQELAEIDAFAAGNNYQRTDYEGNPIAKPDSGRPNPRQDLRANQIDGLNQRIGRRLADIDYLTAEPLGVREGAVLVWAGMRGAVTVAAAQTLPEDTPNRSALVLVAFIVAAGMLLVQGSTLAWVVQRLGVARPHRVDPMERTALTQTMADAALAALGSNSLRRPNGAPFEPALMESTRRKYSAVARSTGDDEDSRGRQISELRLAVLNAQREALLEQRRMGSYSSASLREAMSRLDADQISIELRFTDDE